MDNIQISSRMLTKLHAKDKYILHLICEENHKSVKKRRLPRSTTHLFSVCSHFFTLMCIRQNAFCYNEHKTAHGLYRRAYAEQKSGKGVS